MYNYCTLFDSNYLTRGLAMYESLKKCSDSFHLYIFVFDDRAYEILKKLKLDFIIIISLKDFEDEKLLEAKKGRSKGEYCWTCTPSAIKYCLEKYSLESCTYIDADLYFYANPSVLIEEMKEKSVLITEHRYTKKYDQSKTSGIYCVQFMTFKNDKNGLEVLNWWRNACLEWCYARFEDGKFGDQKYLDDWTQRFKGIHVMKNIGAGVAPWNIQQYNVFNKDFKLVFYHFHGFKFLKGNKVELGSYEIRKSELEKIYKPYIVHLLKIQRRLENLGETYDYNGSILPEINFRQFIVRIKRIIKNSYNIYTYKQLGLAWQN